MKAGTVFILLALALSIVSPLSITLSSSGDGTFLISLDVCSAANPAVSSHSSVPAIHECPCLIRPAESIGLLMIIDPVFHPFLISSEDDQPPRV